jgi:hypothetical protein
MTVVQIGRVAAIADQSALRVSALRILPAAECFPRLMPAILRYCTCGFRGSAGRDCLGTLQTDTQQLLRQNLKKFSTGREYGMALAMRQMARRIGSRAKSAPSHRQCQVRIQSDGGGT